MASVVQERWPPKENDVSHLARILMLHIHAFEQTLWRLVRGVFARINPYGRATIQQVTAMLSNACIIVFSTKVRHSVVTGGPGDDA